MFRKIELYDVKVVEGFEARSRVISCLNSSLEFFLGFDYPVDCICERFWRVIGMLDFCKSVGFISPSVYNGLVGSVFDFYVGHVLGKDD